MTAVHEAMLAAGLESPFAEWIERLDQRPPGPPERVTTRVGAPSASTVRDQALLAHATQIDPDGWFFSDPDASCSARSGRPRTTSSPAPWWTSELPEDDLFAGVREQVGR